MYPAAIYYYANGYVGWMPYATYPQLVVSYQPPPPLAHTTFGPLPTMPTYLPPQNFPNGVYYPQQDEPPIPPQGYRPRTQDRIERQEDDSSPPATVVPGAPTPSDPYSPPLDRVRAQAYRDVHSTSRFAIDTILALPEQPFGMPRLEWDLADNPIRNLTNRPENWWIQTRNLARAGVRDGTRELERLVLVFARLPRERDVQIEVTHMYPATILDAVDEDVSWVTVHDMFIAILQWLVSPIGVDEMERLEGERFNTVIRAEARRRGRAGRAATTSHQPFLKIDYL